MSNTPRTDAAWSTCFYPQVLTAGECARIMHDECEKLERDNAALRAALEECVYFADNSEGIVGWHLNGQVLRWEEVEAIAKARAALAAGGAK